VVTHIVVYILKIIRR